MKLIIAMMAALVLSTSVMAVERGGGGGDGGSGTFERAMQHNDAAMEKYRAQYDES